MPTILVFDDFNKPDNPTSLGTANTGQVWSQASGPAGLGISSNNAVWTWPTAAGCRGVIESTAVNASTRVTLVNQSVMDQNFGEFFGLIFRYVDNSFYWSLIFQKFPGPTNQLRLQRTYSGATTTIIDVNINLADGDVISVNYCGVNFEVFVNDVSQGTYDDTGNPQNYGTSCGLIANSVSDFGFIAPVLWNDFTVETIDGCANPGADWTIPALTWNASSTVRRPSGGIGTVRVDQGEGNLWYVVAPISDSGDELRSKTVKAVRVTGKLTNAAAKLYGYDVSTPIVTANLEDGTNSTTGALNLPNSTSVAQSPRVQTNVSNAVLHTVRVEGDDRGETTRDRVDEILTEQSDIGVRR